MQYRTRLNVKDTKTLRGEIDEVWAVFRPDVERRNFKWASIQAAGAPIVIQLGPRRYERPNTVNFLFTRAADGTWECVNDQAPPHPLIQY